MERLACMMHAICATKVRCLVEFSQLRLGVTVFTTTTTYLLLTTTQYGLVRSTLLFCLDHCPLGRYDHFMSPPLTARWTWLSAMLGGPLGVETNTKQVCFVVLLALGTQLVCLHESVSLSLSL